MKKGRERSWKKGWVSVERGKSVKLDRCPHSILEWLRFEAGFSLSLAEVWSNALGEDQLAVCGGQEAEAAGGSSRLCRCPPLAEVTVLCCAIQRPLNTLGRGR